MATYDVTVIGSGPGGYYCAIRCAQLGMKVAIIERYNTLGGTCLNVGCIPSKALLDSTHIYHDAVHEFKEHGIKMKDEGVDFNQMIERKRQVVKQTCDGVSFLMKKNKIDVYTGVGAFKDKNTIAVKRDNGSEATLTTNKTVIATGSKPASLPNIEIDKKRVISSTEALELDEIPKKMAVIGGGYIGLEIGSVYKRLGTEVEVIEYADRLIPAMDETMASEL
ncbi:MAG: dihydrolipoyl dehydrogenase, partial [Bacteroidetes bacterium SW_10_40_5]